MPARIVAIHQPNFFPWMGYFKKIQLADVFVFLDAVEISKGSWFNRVKLKISGEARWVTCPIHLTHSTQLINTSFMAETRWKRKLLRSLEIDYPSSFQSWVARFVNREEKNLAEYNGLNVEEISMAMKLGSRFVRQSDLGLDTDLRGSTRLVDICKQLDATCYLAGDGATAYEDVSLFGAAGIKYRALSYVHPVYPQTGRGEFVYGLSILDTILNIGINKTREIL